MSVQASSRTHRFGGTQPGTELLVLVPGILCVTGGLAWYAIQQGQTDRSISLFLVAVGGAGVFLACLISPKNFPVLFLIAMIFSPRFAVGAVPGRPVELRLDDFVIVAMTLSLFLRALLGRLHLPLIRPILIFLMFSIISTCIGLMLGAIPLLRSAFYLMREVEYFFILFAIANIRWHKQALEKSLAWVAALSVILPVWVLWQYMQGIWSIRFPLENLHARPQIGGFCTLFGLLALARWLYPDRGRGLFWPILSYSLHLAATIAVESRTYFVALCLGPVIMILFGPPNRFGSTRRVLAHFGLLVGFVSLLAILPRTHLASRMSKNLEGAARMDLERALGPRYHVIQNWAVTLNSPVRALIGNGKGWGPGDRRGSFQNRPWSDGMYNRLIGEGGIFGCVAFFAILAFIWRDARRNMYRPVASGAQSLSAALWTFFILIPLIGIFQTPFIVTKVAEPFWLLTGLMYASQYLPESTPAAPAPKVLNGGPGPQPAPNREPEAGSQP